MENEDKVILREILEVTRENEKKINRLYRGLWISRVWSVVYWIIVIGAAAGSFYFLQPYLDELKTVYGGFQNKVDTVKETFQ